MGISRQAKLKRAINVSARSGDRAPVKPDAASRFDVVAQLRARGRITQHHLRIIDEIRLVHEAVGRGMFPTTLSARPRSRLRRHHETRDFLDRMTCAERDAWERCYLPWSRELSTEVAAGLPGTRWLQLVLDVIIDNVPLRQIERRYRLRNGTAFAYFLNGLERYPPET